MNILFYEFGINPLTGGVQRVSYNIAKRLHAEGNRIYVAFKNEDRFDERYDSVFDDYIKVYSLNKEGHRRLVSFVKRYRIEIIINQCGYEAKDTAFLHDVKVECNLKLYSFIHTSPTASKDVLGFRDFRFPRLVLRSLFKEAVYKFYQFDRAKYRKIYHLSDTVVLLSNLFIDDFKTMVGADACGKKIISIPNPVIYPGQQEDILSHKENILLVVARMGETQKKLSRVLDTWKLISGRLPDWKLIFVGDGSESAVYKAIAEKQHLPRLTFTGTTDPYPYYVRSSVFLMTSATEGFGMTLLEAQQCGVVPVVMDSYKSLYDLIINEENGFITPDGNLFEFSEKILLLANDRDMRVRLAKNAMRSTKLFSEDRIFTQWKLLLSSDE